MNEAEGVQVKLFWSVLVGVVAGLTGVAFRESARAYLGSLGPILAVAVLIFATACSLRRDWEDVTAWELITWMALIGLGVAMYTQHTAETRSLGMRMSAAEYKDAARDVYELIRVRRELRECEQDVEELVSWEQPEWCAP